MEIPGLLGLRGHFRKATQVHHSRGRLGDLLLDERFWVAVSAKGHEWIHENISHARKVGLICEPGQWNTKPKEQHEWNQHT